MLFRSLIAILAGYGGTVVILTLATGSGTEGWQAYAVMMASSLVLGAVFIALGYFVSAIVRERATAVGAAIGLWLVFVVLYDLLLFGLLTMDEEQKIGQQLFSMLMLVNPTDTYRVLNLSLFEGVSEAAGIAGVASEAGLSGTLLVSSMLVWIILPLGATVLVFQSPLVADRNELPPFVERPSPPYWDSA